MNREIKFRGWDRDSKEMYSFDLYDALMNGVEDYSEEWPVMQFTGLLDKNGKEIYEGDVVKMYRGSIAKWVVEWDERDACFNPSMHLRYSTKEMEIIGNIYENPELLEQSNEGV